MDMDTRQSKTTFNRADDTMSIEEETDGGGIGGEMEALEVDPMERDPLIDGTLANKLKKLTLQEEDVDVDQPSQVDLAIGNSPSPTPMETDEECLEIDNRGSGYIGSHVSNIQKTNIELEKVTFMGDCTTCSGPTITPTMNEAYVAPPQAL